MPDGILPPTQTTEPELAADTNEGRLVRHVRRNLVLWSGGTTLIVLLLLGVALYVAVASSLANSATSQLDSRFDQVRSSLTGEQPDPDQSGPYGYIFGGGGSGTIALAVDGSGNVLAPRGFRVPPGLPDMAGVASARSQWARRPDHLADIAWLRTGRREPVGLDAGPDPDRERRPHRRPDLHRPGHRRSGRRAADARHDADRAVDRWRAGGGSRLRLRDHLCAAGARPDPRIPVRPACCSATAARVRRRRQPRAAHAADGHPEQRRLPRAAPRRAGRTGRHGARGHRRRSDPHDRHRRGPAPAGALRLGRRRARARSG